MHLLLPMQSLRRLPSLPLLETSLLKSLLLLQESLLPLHLTSLESMLLLDPLLFFQLPALLHTFRTELSSQLCLASLANAFRSNTRLRSAQA
jgi:hypothetical protein